MEMRQTPSITKAMMKVQISELLHPTFHHLIIRLLGAGTIHLLTQGFLRQGDIHLWILTINMVLGLTVPTGQVHQGESSMDHGMEDLREEEICNQTEEAIKTEKIPGKDNKNLF